MRGFTEMRGKDSCNLKGLSDVDFPACAGPICSCRMRAAVLDSATNETLERPLLVTSQCCFKCICFCADCSDDPNSHVRAHTCKHTQTRNLWIGLFWKLTHCILTLP